MSNQASPRGHGHGMATAGALLLAILASGALAAQTIETPAFTLKLPGDWKPQTTSDPDEHSYYSEAMDVRLATSFVVLDTLPTDTESVANRLKEVARDSEHWAAKHMNLDLTMAEPTVTQLPWGHRVAYFGHDNSHRQFRYVGLVLDRKAINVYVQSQSRSERELEAIVDRLLDGLAF